MLIDPVPLSADTLKGAISLIKRILPYKGDQKWAIRGLKESLTNGKYGQKYWVATNAAGEVIGITGLYVDHAKDNDSSTAWLGWFGVHPDYRRQGIGTKLLLFSIKQAKKRGFKQLKLYTSFDENEKAAHRLYAKHGFRRTGLGEDAETIYYEKEITAKQTNKKDVRSAMYQIKIEWEGPFEFDYVIENKNDGGRKPTYDGNDYGLYQIYGKHILCGSDTLLYLGKAFRQTFSQRFRKHKREWLKDEEEIEVYVGRIHDPKRHSPKDGWKSWETDVALAENILIYKYSPNYNSVSISNEADLSSYDKVKVCLVHSGNRHRLEAKDIAPDDF